MYIVLCSITKCHVLVITWALMHGLVDFTLSTLGSLSFMFQVYISGKMLLLTLQLLHVANYFGTEFSYMLIVASMHGIKH